MSEILTLKFLRTHRNPNTKLKYENFSSLSILFIIHSNVFAAWAIASPKCIPLNRQKNVFKNVISRNVGHSYRVSSIRKNIFSTDKPGLRPGLYSRSTNGQNAKDEDILYINSVL